MTRAITSELKFLEPLSRRSLCASQVLTHDWSNSVLGPPEEWPAELFTSLGLVLASPGPKILLWGSELILFYNDAYVPLLGTEFKDGIGETYPAFRPDAWPLVRPHVEAAMSGDGRILHNFVGTPRRFGHEETANFTLCYNPVILRTGLVGGVIGEIYETTTQAHLQAHLEAEIQRFQELFAHAPVFFASGTAPDFRFEFVNDAYSRLLGGRPLVGRTVAEAIPEIEPQGFNAILTSVYETGQPFLGRDMVLDLQNNPEGALDRYFVDFIYQPIFGEDGAVRRILCVGQDVTDAHYSRIRANELQQEIHQASSLTSMGIMASTIAHELNQPLAAAANYIAGTRRALAAGDAAPVNEQATQGLIAAGAQIERAGEIIRHVRNILAAQPESRQPIQLKEIVEQCLRLLSNSGACEMIEIKLDIDDELAVFVDAIQVEQVFTNLLRNACAAMDKADEKRLRVSGKSNHDHFVTVRVSDTGRGFGDRSPESLFDTFGASATGGLGVGLSVSRTIVEAHGGRISAANNPGAGATFSFTLPRVRHT